MCEAGRAWAAEAKAEGGKGHITCTGGNDELPAWAMMIASRLRRTAASVVDSRLAMRAGHGTTGHAADTQPLERKLFL